MIAKTARNPHNFERTFRKTDTARQAWSEIIDLYKKQHPGGKVLLPAYIGWSPNEGSGIFDSVVNAGIKYDFYTLDRFLQIDFSDLKQKVNKEVAPLVLLVHYFGIPDKHYESIVAWLKQHQHFFVEDCAHAMLTDLIGGRCGREGKFAFYSLHKMLPFDTGGVLVDNRQYENLDISSGVQYNPISLGYDLFEISKRRRANYILLVELLRDTPGLLLIHARLEPGVYPQTLPVLIESDSRNDLYFLLNDAGFGVVSLYHTMIDQLSAYTNEAVTYTSQHILNLPVHQDATEEDLKDFTELLKKSL